MTIFFLLVTLEVKRELLIGELNSLAKAALPVIAAMGGIIIPAIIYLSLNATNHQTAHGWAIPTATDIAFSLAILMLLKSSIPPSLKIFLTTLAIIDDLGAIIIIAIFYTSNLDSTFIYLALLGLALLVSLNSLGIKNYSYYVMFGIILWIFIFNSGIHSTIAGVLLGFCVPLTSRTKYSPLKKLEHVLQPWVAYGILPLFALANTGLIFSKVTLQTLFHPITLGIFLGLFVGKQVGVFLASWIAVKTKLAKLPNAINWYHLYGLSVICGIGFTMSLFIGDLSFDTNQVDYSSCIKIGVLSGSILSGIVGSLILWTAGRSRVKKL